MTTKELIQELEIRRKNLESKVKGTQALIDQYKKSSDALWLELLPLERELRAIEGLKQELGTEVAA